MNALLIGLIFCSIGVAILTWFEKRARRIRKKKGLPPIDQHEYFWTKE